MSVDNIKSFVLAEKAKLERDVDALTKRIAALDLVLTTLAGGAPQATGKPAKKPGRRPAAARRGRPRAKLLTVREGIIQAVGAAKKPLPVKDIIAGARALSGGAVASIRTQINILTKEGALRQLPYEGRGFAYATGGGRKAKKVVRKARRRKAAAKPAPAPAPVPEAPPA